MAKRSNFLIALSLIIIPILPSTGLPYVLPSSQIIAIMTNKFANIKTLRIIQHTKIKDLNQEKEKAFGEIVSLGSPYLYRSEIPGQPGKRLIIHNSPKTLRIINGSITYDGESYGFIYRFLLLAHDPERLSEMLKEVGINIDKVFLTRFEGKIAYLIGEKEEGSARLLVDKEQFLPILLKYGDYLFHFSDYFEFMEHAWYPFQIVYSCKGDITEEYTVKDIKANLPIDVSLFDIPQIRAQFSKFKGNPNIEYRNTKQMRNSKYQMFKTIFALYQ
jgi:outer membrane lipoprotein-sorting protein